MPQTPATRRRPAVLDERRRPQRPAQILEAACRAILARGFPATRIVDIAREAGTSTGTIHYHFDARDEVLVAALKWASGRLFERLDTLMDAAGDDRRRLGQLLALATPHAGMLRDQYVLWVELWVRVLHEPHLLADCEEISSRWRGYFFAIIRRGTADRVFDPVVGADEAAERLIALVDGLGFETVVGYSWTSPERMLELALTFAAEQLRVPREDLERAADDVAADR